MSVRYNGVKHADPSTLARILALLTGKKISQEQNHD